MAAPATGAVAWIALGIAGVGLGLALSGRGSPPGPVDATDDADLYDREGLENRIHDAEVRLEAAEAKVRALEEGAGRLEALEREVREVRALASRAPAAGPAAGGAAGGEAAGTVEVPRGAGAGAEDLLRSIRAGEFSGDEVFGLMNRARALGVLDEALAAMEAHARSRAGDADARVALGTAYTAKLLSVPDGPERGAWASKALGAYDAALAIDPEHWDAQFSRAFNLSQWPDFANRQAEAIRGFEKLVEQQERSTPRKEFVQAYLQLGNTYRKAGNLGKAKEAFERGLRQFPDDETLREQWELLR